MFALRTPMIRAAASARAATTAPAASRGLHFLVTLNDFTDKDALARRMATRPSHLVHATELQQKGILMSGGAILDAPSDSGTMVGSYMMYKAESLEHVHELLKDDPYVQGRVWDYENATITPVRIARLGDAVLEATPKKE
ncbi:hypothetical protein AMAG_12588 [Allomyces macrogynus ATCC 38327]|uniref:YCII-related domain-containing protein n=1 Tax=Allomyces macrogynus (strain ATCC 38327) TaxID=578462 RepID=A0A0L0SZE8_ALLM3|nr:hypothetical protein AMAG_12588 [Allomyces macrogynus ATCC 38327]|eukprot:KNE67871.1 hypothetical protein AMAG_12588 [Allomyces macrogynus ATCC 38327]